MHDYLSIKQMAEIIVNERTQRGDAFQLSNRPAQTPAWMATLRQALGRVLAPRPAAARLQGAKTL